MRTAPRTSRSIHLKPSYEGTDPREQTKKQAKPMKICPKITSGSTMSSVVWLSLTP